MLRKLWVRMINDRPLKWIVFSSSHPQKEAEPPKIPTTIVVYRDICDVKLLLFYLLGVTIICINIQNTKF